MNEVKRRGWERVWATAKRGSILAKIDPTAFGYVAHGVRTMGDYFYIKLRINEDAWDQLVHRTSIGILCLKFKLFYLKKPIEPEAPFPSYEDRKAAAEARRQPPASSWELEDEDGDENAAKDGQATDDEGDDEMEDSPLPPLTQ